jgi:hypothetical protein
MWPETKIKLPVRTNGENAAAGGATGGREIPKALNLS